MADVILIQPKVGDWDRVRSHPAIPLALLAAARIVAKKFTVKFIDMRVSLDWKERLLAELGEKPFCVGITALTGRQIKHAIEVSKIIKQHSNVPIVWGGIHASLLSEVTLRNENIDFVIKGEGEHTFYELIDALKNGDKNFELIPGLWHKKNGEIINGGERRFANLDDLPAIPYRLIELGRYIPLFKGRRTMYLETSRGCPNQCAFCYNKTYNMRRWRAHSSKRVIEDLKEIVHKHNIRSFYIIDDNFFFDLNRAREIAEGIIREKLDIYWESQGINVDSGLAMDQDYIKVLVKSGLKKIHFGAESGSDRILEMVNKRLKTSQIREVNRKFAAFGIICQFNFMSGFPDETYQDIRKTVNLCLELMKDNKKAIISPICPYTPYPGTDLYQQAINDGFQDRQSLEEWVHSDYGDNLWTSSKRMKSLRALFFTSMFLDVHRSQDMITSSWLKWAINTYRPLAKFRFKNLFFKCMPEFTIKKLLFKDLS